LFTNWIADSLTLWKSAVTDDNLWTAASYYAILIKGPTELLYALGAIIIVGVLALLLSIREGEAGNIMFDGGSICVSPPLFFFQCSDKLKLTMSLVLFSWTIVTYLYSVIPSDSLSLL
jgi:hypothetical protein